MKAYNFLLGILILWSSTLLAASTGKLNLVIFDQDKVASDLVVKLSTGDILISDKDGHIGADLPEGEYEAKVLRNGEVLQTFKFKLKADDLTDVMLTLMPKKNEVDVQNPEVASETKVEGPKATVRGVIKSFNGDKPIRGARVLVRGTSYEGMTDLNGQFSIELPQGSYDLSIIHKDHVTKSLAVTANTEKVNLDSPVLMTPSGLQLDDFVVLAPSMNGSIAAMVEVRRSHSTVADVMGAEQITRTGDGDAGSSLRRVTGVTLVNNQFVYIRGLGERYSNTLFNGATMPSPDPFRRVVPLDLFPSSILESLVVQKGYSADMPAEFGGGVVQIQTKGIPDRKYFNAFVGTSYNTNNRGDILTSPGGRTDWFGKDDGTRAMPSPVANAVGAGKKFVDTDANPIETNGMTGAQLNELGKSFGKNYNQTGDGSNIMPTTNMAFGNNYKLGQVRLGHTTSLVYSNTVLNQAEQMNTYNISGSELLPGDKLIDTRSTRTINAGAMAGVGAEWRGHSVQYMWNMLRRTTDINAVRSGYDDGLNVDARNFRSEWSERQLTTNHFSGKHKIPFLENTKFNWHFNDSKARRYQPDSRYYRYTKDEGITEYSFDYTRGDSNSRLFSDMNEKSNDIKLELEKSFSIFERTGFKARAGLNNIDKSRTSLLSRFGYGYDAQGNATPIVNMTQDMNSIVQQCLDARCFVLKGMNRGTDSFNASQNIRATYGILDVPMTNKLKLSLGYRHEKFSQRVETFENYAAETTPIYSQLNTNDVLPAHSAVYKLNDKMQLRGSYSETLSRPDFKELSNSQWTDDFRNLTVKGNPNLKSATSRNIDARWEWYPSSEESISIGYFTKNFTNPIEETFIVSSDGNVVTYQNAKSAKNSGVELEWRRNLSLISRSLSNFTFGANYAYIRSNVELDTTSSSSATSKSRALQGQSPYVTNASLEYDSTNRKFSGTILYNVFGPRIVQVGQNTAPDIYEQPFQQLDMIFRQRLNERTSITFRAQNLLDSDVVSMQGSEVFRKTKRGRNFILGMAFNI